MNIFFRRRAGVKVAACRRRVLDQEAPPWPPWTLTLCTKQFRTFAHYLILLRICLPYSVFDITLFSEAAAANTRESLPALGPTSASPLTWPLEGDDPIREPLSEGMASVGLGMTMESGTQRVIFAQRMHLHTPSRHTLTMRC